MVTTRISQPFIVYPEDEGYTIVFPSCRGCMTQADTWQEVEEMAADALKLWLDSGGIPEEPTMWYALYPPYL